MQYKLRFHKLIMKWTPNTYGLTKIRNEQVLFSDLCMNPLVFRR